MDRDTLYNILLSNFGFSPTKDQARVLYHLAAFILTEKGMSYRRLLDERLAKDGLEIKPVLEIGRTDLICDLVSAGSGVSFLPDFVTEEAVKKGSIVRLSAKGYDIDIWKQLLYRKDKWMTLPMNAIIEHLSVNVL